MKWQWAIMLLLSLGCLTAVTFKALKDQILGPSAAPSSLRPTSGGVAGRAPFGEPVPGATSDGGAAPDSTSLGPTSWVVAGRARLGERIFDPVAAGDGGTSPGSTSLRQTSGGVAGRAPFDEPVPGATTAGAGSAAPGGTSPFHSNGPAPLADGVCGLSRESLLSAPDRWWIRSEYLLWWVKDGPIPPLVTTSPQESLGVLGQPGTTVLIGGEAGDLNYRMRSGGRFTAGVWLDACQTCGLEGTFFFLCPRSTDFAAESLGDPLLGRPFFNVVTGQEDSQQVANLEQPGLPNLLPLTGRVAVSSASRLWGAETNALNQVCSGCLYRVDLLAGFRYLSLDEGLTITEQLRVPDDSFVLPGSTIDLFDSFGTRNHFYGGQVGARAEVRRGRWQVDLSGKVALGVTNQTVAINGGTVLAEPGLPVVTGLGGLLAVPSNIGHYDRNRFSVVPEIGVNAGYQITGRLRGYLGYTFLYWSSVARPGNHIDRSLNPTQLPPGTLNGPARPAFAFAGTDFWAQGVNVGLELRY